VTTLIWITCGLLAVVIWLFTCALLFKVEVLSGTFLKRVENATVRDLLFVLLIVAVGPISLIVMFVCFICALLIVFWDSIMYRVGNLPNVKLFKRN
jgi:hypothetical protein